MKTSKIQAIICNPEKYFDTPEDVINDNTISAEQKKRILESWSYDQKRLLTSESENMGQDAEIESPSEKLQDIKKAKDTLL